MDTATLLEDVGPRRDRRGRSLLGDAEREVLLGGFASSGLTQRAYAEKHGVNYNTFVAWLSNWRRVRGSGPAAGGFVELSVGARSSACMEWALTDGSVVRGSPADLAVLMRELKG